MDQKIANSLIGAAGVHFVVSELSLRGLIALPTIRNTAGFDVIVVSVDGSWHANLQVKASKNKVSFWPVGKRYKELSSKDTFVVFVRYLKNESRFEVFLENGNQVARQVASNIKRDNRAGYTEWAPYWSLPKDEEDIKKVKRQWENFGQGHVI